MWHPLTSAADVSGLIVAFYAFRLRYGWWNWWRHIAAFCAVPLYERSSDAFTVLAHCCIAVSADTFGLADDALAGIGFEIRAQISAALFPAFDNRIWLGSRALFTISCIVI
jgi:hypothetical protein